jgi:hypothetical protein
MIDKNALENIKNKYKNVHPLMFTRSVEKSKTNGELFDIVSTIPEEFPIIWNESKKRWVVTNDIFLSNEFKSS